MFPEPEGNPEGEAKGICRGLRLYFTVYPDLSHYIDILNYNSSIVLPGRAIFEELILPIALAAGAIFSSILPVLYWECTGSTGSIFYSTLSVDLENIALAS